MMITTYALYLLISIAMTVWVAHNLSTNGRVFLVESLGGKEVLADSLNHLLVVGFYLINIGYVTLALKYGDKPSTAVESIEFLSTKVGLVLVVLGAMHFFNMYVITRAGQALTKRMPWAVERRDNSRVAKEDPTDRVLSTNEV